MPFLLDAAGCLTAQEQAQRRADARTADHWAANATLAGQHGFPYSLMTSSLSDRITLAAGDPEDHLGTWAGSQPLDILMSPATHSEWGLPSAGHESHPISLGQTVPILQT